MKRKLPIVNICVIVLLIVVMFVCANAMLVNSKLSYGIWNSQRTDAVHNFVVAGVDESKLRSDVILLCQLSLSDNSVEILQIPRDTKVNTKRFDKKINSAYGSNGKINALIEEIRLLTGIKPEKYVVITFDGFRRLIDAIGGVEVDVPFRMKYNDPKQNLVIDLQPGRQVLDGKKAEMFVRFRMNNDGTGYADGDIGRIEKHKVFYKAVAEKLFSVNNVWNIPEILSVVAQSVETDFGADEIEMYLRRIPKFSADRISFYTLPGVGGYDKNGVSYFFCDEEKTEVLMRENFGVNRKTTEK
ncbi:MAG: LCP family protein [Clostridia bacterium]|nr:LCP family protein [Clostridia bacterium]